MISKKTIKILQQMKFYIIEIFDGIYLLIRKIPQLYLRSMALLCGVNISEIKNKTVGKPFIYNQQYNITSNKTCIISIN